MEHGFRQPFVAVVFQQVIDEGDARIAGDDRAVEGQRLQAADDGRGIHHRLELVVIIEEIEGRQELHLGFG